MANYKINSPMLETSDYSKNCIQKDHINFILEHAQGRWPQILE